LTYTRPFITPRFIAFGGDSRTRRLSLAVMLLDSFTEAAPRVAIRVRLKESPRAVAVRNQSGLFCFEEITPPGPYTLTLDPERVNSDWYYLEPTGAVWEDTFERPINLPMPDPRAPLEIATFVPRPSYPFPTNATLVRGKVTRGTPDGVAGAIVSTTYQHEDPPGAPSSPFAVRTLTDSQGEFVLFFKRLPGATQTITLTADKNGAQAQQPVIITEGTTRKGVQLDLP
jgi:hypothetical protein